jgi:hypothetical protein
MNVKPIDFCKRTSVAYATVLHSIEETWHSISVDGRHEEI